MQDVGLAGGRRGGAGRLGVRPDGALPVEGHGLRRARRHRPQRVRHEEEHRPEERDRQRQDGDAEQRSARRAPEARRRQPQRDPHACDPVVDDAAVRQLDRPLVARDHVGIVGGHDERERQLGVERVDQVQHTVAGVRVEMAGRLVAEEHPRPLRKGSGNCDPLRLAAGQLRRQVVGLVGEPDKLEQLSGVSPDGSAAAARAAKAMFSNAVKFGSRFAPWKM